MADLTQPAELRTILKGAARQILVAHGIGRITTRGVTERAGLPLGAFHAAYKAKDDLLDELFDELVPAGDWAEFVGIVDRGDALAQVELMVWQIRRDTEREKHGG